MYSATAYNHAYSDSGLFCIHASAPPTHLREMVEVIVRELVGMAGSVSSQELQVSFIDAFSYSIMFTNQILFIFLLKYLFVTFQILAHRTIK